MSQHNTASAFSEQSPFMKASTTMESIDTFLTKKEVEFIKTAFNAVQIEAQVTGPLTDSHVSRLNHQIKIRRGDSAVVTEIIHITIRNRLRHRGCPACQSQGYEEVEKRGLWQRLYSWGKVQVECLKCRTKFYV